MTHHDAVDTMAAERYLLDEMPDSDRQAFEEHYFSCAECADDLRTATAMLQGARAGFAGASTAKQPAGHVVSMAAASVASRRTAWYRSAALPWAIAATLAVVVGYESLWGVAPLQHDGAPLALAPVTLRPESRGREAVVPVGAHDGPVSLAIEVNDAPEHGEITFDLRSVDTGDSRPIVSGRAPAPSAGAPLLLLMPAWTLDGPVHYILSVHDAAGTGRLIGEYRFAVSTE